MNSVANPIAEAVDIDAGITFLDYRFGSIHEGHIALVYLSGPKDKAHERKRMIDLAADDWYERARQWFEIREPDENVYVSVAVFKDGESREKINFKCANAIIIENDDHRLPDDLPPWSYRVESSPGRWQTYYELTEPIEDVATYERYAKALADHTPGVRHQAIDAARILRVPGFPNVWRGGAMVNFEKGSIEPHRLEDLDTALATELTALDTKGTATAVLSEPVSPPMSDDEIIERARRAGNGEKFIRLFDDGDCRQYVNGDGAVDDNRADQALANLISFWTQDHEQIDRLMRRSALARAKWEDRLDYRERTIDKALDSDRPHYGEDTNASNASNIYTLPLPVWPAPMSEEAFHGLAGEVVRAIEPETEADIHGVLTNFLTLFGNCAGRGAHFLIEDKRHYANLFVVTVGNTSSGRKGVALDRARQAFRLVDDLWLKEHVKGGASSSEGIIYQVRDQVQEWKAATASKPGRMVVTDPGIADKRLLLAETEFAAVLKQGQREGNTLSELIRNAWDSGNLATLTRNNPLTATDAHLSILGNVTKADLTKYFDSTEAANGFGNRFLWACVRRSKELPDGGSVDLTPFAARLREALHFAQNCGEMRRDTEARARWHAVYSSLTEERPGLYGAMTARAAPMIVRLSMIYALLDCSDVIRREHLEAALAVWQYCDASVRYIFGEATGNGDADTILAALRGAAPNGLTRTEIMRDVLSGHANANRINTALMLLAHANLAHCEQEGGGRGKGRPTETWYAGAKAQA